MTNKKLPIYINGLGAYIPQKVLTNSDLEKMVDTSDEWIFTRTGIRERHIAAPDEYSSTMGANAASQALEDAHVTPDEVDYVIVSTVTPDFGCFPATACLIQRELGIKNGPCSDIESACAGMIYALEMAAAFIQRGPFKKILVVASDKLSAITDWQDRSTCILFGDGASAFLVSDSPQNAKAELLNSYLYADSSQADIIHLPAGGSRLPASEETIRNRMHFLHMQGREVFKSAVKDMSSAVAHVLQEGGVTPEEIRLFVPHQANMRIIEAIAKYLDQPLERFMTTVQRTGNTSSGSIGIALESAYRENRLRKDDLLVIVGFGSGITSAAALLRWRA